MGGELEPLDPREVQVTLRELAEGPTVVFPDRKELMLRGRASMAQRDYNPDDEVPPEVDAMLEEGVPKATREQYEHQWGRFIHWCGSTGREHLPPTMATMRYYIWSHWVAAHADGRLRGRKGRPYAPATVRTAVYSISAVLQWLGYASPTRHPAVQKQLRGYAARWEAAGHRPDRSHAITDAENVRMARTCDLGTVQGLRNATMVRLQHDMGCRGGELLNLNLGDVSWVRTGEQAQVRVWISRSKRDQDARGRAVIVEAVAGGDDWDVDPTQLLGTWVKAMTGAGYDDPKTPLFPKVNPGGRRADGRLGGSITSTRLDRQAYDMMHDRLVARAGVDKDPETGLPRTVTPHGERAGHITEAEMNGVLAEQVAPRTGHAIGSPTIHSYFRAGTATGDANPGTRIRRASRDQAAG